MLDGKWQSDWNMRYAAALVLKAHSRYASMTHEQLMKQLEYPFVGGDDGPPAPIMPVYRRETMSNSYLKVAGNLIKGALADANEQLKKGNEEKRGVLWKVLVNLICYANNEVFAQGYTKKLAKQFKTDLMEEAGISDKQAAKYTESISSALGVRGIRAGMKVIDGLPAAANDGVKMVEDLLKAKEIETFTAFVRAVRTEKTPVQVAAIQLMKLTPKQRDLARQMADKNDSETDTEEE